MLSSLRIRIIPTPAPAAAAPNLPNPRTRGRIRVLREDNPEVYYLSKILQRGSGNSGGRVMLTRSLADALEVEYESVLPSDDLRILFIPDVSGRSRPRLMMLTFSILELTSGV